MENVHKIRVMFGNGLRPDIWEEFQTRFKIPKIVEFFGATEGIGAFINICNKVGALGRFSPLTRKLGLGEQRLVKYDPINDQPLRDKHGRCIDIKPGSDGRAGMAAIVLRDNQEVTSDILQKIYKHCQKSLPSYARPLFLRFVKELILTQTMKHRKIELVDEGFDPNKVNDPMYVVDDKVKTYVSMSADKYQAILTSKL
ncbi:hypothetical protein KUTeg_018546 [Tegillarca granosa]|uniref:BEN domain-containing protein n=1 Tax=Tegillarca granosa TaxID=220873 RepID=A0ABQ9ENY6_TEGGR|nr:hypothetical protein KUTeg_018546 [Tegillarca granosa]